MARPVRLLIWRAAGWTLGLTARIMPDRPHPFLHAVGQGALRYSSAAWRMTAVISSSRPWSRRHPPALRPWRRGPFLRQLEGGWSGAELGGNPAFEGEAARVTGHGGQPRLARLIRDQARGAAHRTEGGWDRPGKRLRFPGSRRDPGGHLCHRRTRSLNGGWRRRVQRPRAQVPLRAAPFQWNLWLGRLSWGFQRCCVVGFHVLLGLHHRFPVRRPGRGVMGAGGDTGSSRALGGFQSRPRSQYAIQSVTARSVLRVESAFCPPPPAPWGSGGPEASTG